MADLKGSETAGTTDSLFSEMNITTPLQGGVIDFPAPAGDATPPTIAIVSPPVGTTISRTAMIKFRVTDDSGTFRRILPALQFPDGSVELIHDGENFTSKFTGSTRTVISLGFEYNVGRIGGWPDSPTLIPFAYDISGNENL